jgi:uncharacterized membrane protein
VIAQKKDAGLRRPIDLFNGSIHAALSPVRLSRSILARHRFDIPPPHDSLVIPAVLADSNQIRWSMPLTRRTLLPLLALAAGLALPGAARADFRLCNNATGRVSVAIAYTNGKNWVSEGWWNLKSKACEVLLRGNLAAQYYYIYAMDERGGEWKGKSYMCTRDREFHIEGRDNCLVRGFDRSGFFEIDTGKDAKNWTVQLTDATQQPR